MFKPPIRYILPPILYILQIIGIYRTCWPKGYIEPLGALVAHFALLRVRSVANAGADVGVGLVLVSVQIPEALTALHACRELTVVH